MRIPLRVRLLAAFLLLGVLPLAGAGALVYRQGEARLAHELEARLATVAELKAQQIRAWTEERQAAVAHPAALPTLERAVAALMRRAPPDGERAAVRALRADLERLRRGGGFTELFLVEPAAGRVVLSTDRAQEGKLKADRPYVREGRRAPFVQHVYYSLALGRPVMAFSAPVRDTAGHVLAILVGRVDLAFLDRLMGERAGLGRTGQTFLVNRANYFVSERAGRSPHGLRPVFSEGVRRALAGETGTGRYVNHEGRAVVAAFRWVPEIGLALIAEMDAAEAMRPIQAFWYALVSVVGLVGAAAVAASVALSYGITKPLGRLAAAAAAIGRGEFDQRVAVAGAPELRVLAQAFHAMTDGLERLQATLRRQVAERTAELTALNELAAATAEAETAEALLEAALERILRLLGREVGTAFLRDGEALRLVAYRGLPAELVAELHARPLDVGEGIVGEAAVAGRCVVLRELSSHPRVARVSARELGLRAFVAVPLRARGGVAGVLAVGGRDPAPIPEDRLAFLDALGHQLGAVVEIVRLTARATARSRELEGLATITRELSGLRAPAELLPQIVEQAAQLLGADAVGIRVLEGDELVLVARTDAAAPVMPRHRLRVGEGLPGRVAAEGRPVIVADFAADPDVSPGLRARALAAGFRGYLGVPLRAAGRTVGMLGAYTRSRRGFGPEAVGLAAAFADQAAIALENARLFEETRLRQVRLEALLEVSRRLARLRELPLLLDAIAEACGRLLGSGSVGFRLLEGDELVVTGTWGDASRVMLRRHLRLGESLSGVVAATGRPLLVTDVAEDPRVLVEHRAALARAGYRGWLGVPVKLGDRVLGVLSVRGRRSFAAADLEVATALAAQAAVAIENARLAQAQEVRAARLRALVAVSRAISESLDPAVVLRAVGQAARDLMGARLAAFWLADTRARRLDVLAVADDGAGSDHPIRTLAFGQGAVGWVAEQRRVLHVPEVETDARVVGRDWCRARGLRSLLAAPVVLDGELLGVLAVWGDRPFALDADEEELLGGLVASAAVAIRNARLFATSERRRKTAEALAELSRALATAIDDDRRVAQGTVERARNLLGALAAVLYRLEPDSDDLVFVAGVGEGGDWDRRLAAGTGAAGRAVQEGHPFATPDELADPAVAMSAEARARIERSPYRAVAAAPLRVGERIVGALVVGDAAGRVFDAEEQGLLQAFADQAALALDNARLYAETRARLTRLRQLTALSHLVASSLDLRVVLESVARAALALVDADLARIWVVDREAGRLRLGAHEARDGLAVPTESTELPLGHGLVGRVVAERRTRYSPRLVDDPWQVHTAWVRVCGFVSQLAIPMVVGDEAVGALAVLTRRPRQFSDEERDMLELFAAKAAVAVKNARLYEAARKAVADLQAKNAELDSFAYMVSHDLKAPLVTIQGMAGLLLEDQAERLDARGRQYLERIGANVAHMERLIGDLLTLSRVGREGRPPEPVAVDEVVDEALAMLGDEIRRRGVKVTRGELGAVVAVRTQLAEVWTNLLSNAVKYLGEQPDPRVEIGAVDRGEVTEFWVRDNGVGIDPAHHARIFELFQRLKEVEAEGTGVGLPIVKKIVESAGGRIWVESAKGAGATFRFTWPKTARGA